MIRPFGPSKGLRGPEHYWSLMRQAGEAGFRVRDISGCTNGPAFQTVKDYIARLRQMGAIEVFGEALPKGKRKAALIYRVKVDTVHAPVIRRDRYTGKGGRVQEQIWSHLRDGESYNLDFLAVAASTDTLEVKASTVREYVRKLVKAGLVIAERPYAKGASGRKPGAQAGLYRLRPSANSGPKPPKIIGNRIFDPNTNSFAGMPLFSEDDVREGKVSA